MELFTEIDSSFQACLVWVFEPYLECVNLAEFKIYGDFVRMILRFNFSHAGRFSSWPEGFN